MCVVGSEDEEEERVCVVRTGSQVECNDQSVDMVRLKRAVGTGE